MNSVKLSGPSYTQEQADLLTQGDPNSAEYQVLAVELQAKARVQCIELATELGLIQHNCVSADTLDGLPFDNGEGDCTDGCHYAKPPPGGSCPPDEECSLNGEDDPASGDTGLSESETGSTTSNLELEVVR